MTDIQLAQNISLTLPSMLEPSVILPASAMALASGPAQTTSQSLAAYHGKFRKHKVLPRPPSDRLLDRQVSPIISTTPDASVDTSVPHASSASQASSPKILKHQSRRITSGPDPPPTPPNSWRTSSRHQAVPSANLSLPDAAVQTPKASTNRQPATPPDQRSPPTPDVTPPKPAASAVPPRPIVQDRGASHAFTTTTDSRTESFRTAREEPLSSSDEASGTSDQTLRAIHPKALDLALSHLQGGAEQSYGPHTYDELAHFDGEWALPSRLKSARDDRRPEMVPAGRSVPDPVTPRTPPSNKTRIVPRQDELVTPKTAVETTARKPPSDCATVRRPPVSRVTTASRRNGAPTGHARTASSGMSGSRKTHSNQNQTSSSSVIEAVLVKNSRPPRTERKLRHVQGRRELRESPASFIAAREDGPANVTPLSNPRRGSDPRREPARRQESYASTASANSAASARTRREVWNTGGIPVVVIPDRISSQKSQSREASLRSTSSRQSKTTKSMGSSPLDNSPGRSTDLILDGQARWDRSTVASDGLGLRTLEFAPDVPASSSSSSVPLSSSTSTTVSLTVESIRALNEMHRQEKALQQQQASAIPAPAVAALGLASVAEPRRIMSAMPIHAIPTSPIISVQSPQSPRSEGREYSGIESHDDAASTKKYSSRATPFSTMSMETTWTAPEVSEAQAIHMYPHQNSSVLVVNHCAKISDALDVPEPRTMQTKPREAPQITATCPDDGRVTPVQRHALQEVDSPLRNPRAPPDPPSEPPEIKFIPATPSGLTPTQEKNLQLGNVPVHAVGAPKRRPSILRRALRGRRNSISYPPRVDEQPRLLPRSLSFSRNDRKPAEVGKARLLGAELQFTCAETEGTPADVGKLHPHWRPQWYEEDGDGCDCPDCPTSGAYGAFNKYPLVDNRPQALKRSLSSRVKKTFAILPARTENDHRMSDAYGPERRTIRRTPSGNLRVMRRRSSSDSLRPSLGGHFEQRPASARDSQRKFWPERDLRDGRSSKKLRRTLSLSGPLERLPSLTRMWSERKREKRTRELRQMISGPREVRDGVDEVIRKRSQRHGQRGDSSHR